MTPGTTLSKPSISVPFEVYQTDVLPEWIDLNGHMNMAYYGVVFDRGNYAICDALGLGSDYIERTAHGIFAAETHTMYFRELRLGDRAGVRSLIVGADAKRIQFAHEIFDLASGERAATQEVMYLHVDLASRKVTPFGDEIAPRIIAAADDHAARPVPDWCGRTIRSLSKRPRA
jgi:acyl-CoA thioester hydrolase